MNEPKTEPRTKQGPDWTISAPIHVDAKEGTKTIWTKVGVAFNNCKDGDKVESIALRLNLTSKDGDYVLFPFKKEEA